jgi:hypothetical protein
MCHSSGVHLPRRQALKLAVCLAALPRLARAEDGGPDAMARWLAGMPAPAMPATPEWLAYARAEDLRWKRAATRVAVMQEWSARELTPLLPADRPVFYPFAGPDALYACALFGGAPRLVLVGLEPVFAPPDPTRPPQRYFDRLGAALSDLHRLTFFRTHAMQTDFKEDGVLGALLATIARLGGKVTSIETKASPATAHIGWTTPNGLARRLDYLQVDLANAGWKAHPEPLAAIRAMAPYVTFVKAASFLLREPRFSALRQALLDDSAVVVQDDTGIPFRTFDGRWTMRFFGRYEAPGSPFEDQEEPDLRAAFEKRARSPLPFGLGYHIDAQHSNLTVAVKGP